MDANANPQPDETKAKSFLPPINSWKFHLLLGAVAIFILGPLGGISAAYMNFSLGFFIGGQVLAGILGSVVTYGYGAEGKHGANYMQTMAASVASMSGMAVLIQAMVWLGLKEPPAWQLILFFTCIGMFGVGVGMLYTPILVDKMQLAYPSGFAVANILRALTDKALLKQSIAKLVGGTFVGILGGIIPEVFPKMIPKLGSFFQSVFKVPSDVIEGFSASTFGAGMIVGARIAIPGFVVGLVGYELTPWLRSFVTADGEHLLGPNDPFRKIGFVVALGTILGAAAIDLSIIGYQAIQRLREKKPNQPGQAEDWKKTNTRGLIIWVLIWATGLVFVASQILQQPIGFVSFAVALVFLFLLINGISQGISDSNPISSAFVVSVVLMGLLGLKSPAVGLMCAAILLVSCAVGVDMQQDRSTGWRLGTNRKIQFRYQVIGILMGACLAVVLAKVFMSSYAILRTNTFAHPELKVSQWQSGMTYKIVGALEGLIHPKSYMMPLLGIGLAAGFIIELIRKILKNSRRYQDFSKTRTTGKIFDFCVDAIFLPSPYASSFGGFVEFPATVWFGIGGVVSSVFEGFKRNFRNKRESHPAEGEVPADMSATSLVGGGLIAGDSLAALGIGIYGLLQTLIK